MDLRLPGIVLIVAGLVAIVVPLTRGPTLGISPRVGIITGTVLLTLGVALLIYGIAVPQ